MNRRGIYKIAIGGVLTATAVLIMLLGSVVPFATFVSPCLSAICVFYYCLEFGAGAALIVYASISLASLLLAPDKELAFVFIFVMGYYPAVKQACEKLGSKFIAYLIKFAVFDVSVLLMYWLLLRVFMLAPVKAEFEQYTPAIVAGMLVVANITFFLFDIILTRMSLLYIKKSKPPR